MTDDPGVRLWLIVGSAVPCLTVGAAAVASGLGVLALPEVLSQLQMRLPVLFRAHMLAGGLGLALLPVVFATRRVGRCWHKPLGRTAALVLAVASLAGLASALASLATPWSRGGFFVQGLLSITLLIGAWRAIRSGQIATHARLMQSVAATMSGVIVVRLGTWAIVAMDLDFDASYALLAWAAWLVPLGGMIAWQTFHPTGWHLRWPARRPIS